jgi:carbonic anhydrase
MLPTSGLAPFKGVHEMAKGRSDHQPQQEQGTPTYIILSVLFALVIFALEGIKSTISLTGIDQQTQFTMLAFIGLGLTICFFWRRLQDRLFKNMSAFFFTGGLWAYFVATVVLPLLVPGEDVANRMQLVHQFGLGAVVITGFSLMAALLHQQKPVPALLVTTAAGLLVGFGSLYPLLRPSSISMSQDIAIENRHSLRKHEAAHEESHLADASAASGETHETTITHDADKLKLSAHAPLDHEDDSESEEPVHRILREEAAAHDDEEPAPRTLSAAQKARLREKLEPSPRNRISKTAPKPGKHKISLAAKASGNHKAHWEYSGEHGPEHWGDIDSAFRTCSTGLEQSPINILNAWPTRDVIDLDYKPSTFQVVDNGHTVQVNVERGSFASIAGQRYELKQFHFHSPSEHVVENRPYQMEVHFVHSNDKGELAVIGAFINPGKSHTGYQRVWDYIPVKTREPIKPYNVTLDLRALLPASLTAFHYDGSLTTPPCTEKVNWNVLHATLKLSQEQIDRFKLKYPMNARPAQPLNYRKP